jgi:hypothetical protein
VSHAISSPAPFISSQRHTFQGTGVTALSPGNAKDVSWLHDIYRLVYASVGSCEFVEKLFQIQMPELLTSGQASWLHNIGKYPLAKPTFDEAAYFIRWYESAGVCGVDLFDENQLLSELRGWLCNQSDRVSSHDAIYFLVFAIGAQICPRDEDASASLYFDYGRYLTASYLEENLSIATVQVHALMTFYALGAAQNTLAYMLLGTAIRSVYALKLHLPKTVETFSIIERRRLDKTLKAIRVLDLNLSALLGYSPSTAGISIPGLSDQYSASLDLCVIFGKILSSIRSKQGVTAEALQDISKHHRSWATHFRNGLEADGIQNGEFLQDETPNIRLLHLKQAYYWSVILLTRSFFVECIFSYIEAKAIRHHGVMEVRSLEALSHHHEFLVHACINASISIVDLCTTVLILDSEKFPRRLSFVVNSLFVSGLVLGSSCFGDLDTKYALHENLAKVVSLIDLFPGDAVAKRDSETLSLLLDACNAYTRQ